MSKKRSVYSIHPYLGNNTKQNTNIDTSVKQFPNKKYQIMKQRMNETKKTHRV